MRLIGGLQALPGEESRDALMEAARRDPSPEARTASLTALGGMLEGDELLGVARSALDDQSLLVRRVAVGLFSKIQPAAGFPVVIRALRPGDDPSVFAAAAELMAPAFQTFADHALRVSGDGDEATAVMRIAGRIDHPDLPRLLQSLARSRSPEVREAVASLWASRPETANAESLAALTLDPAAGVRRVAARSAAAMRSWVLLERLAADPDSSVRREVALSIGASGRGGRETGAILDRLSTDLAMPVRAAAYVARLLQAMPVSLPPGVGAAEAAAALRAIADLPALREIARAAADENHRLAAALALALVHDQVAHEVARTDPFPSVRHRVGGALELASRPDTPQ
jgi:HEAT repeat protein